MLRLLGAIWSDTLEHLRGCGRDRAECVAFWTGSVDAPDVVDGVVHPVHVATPDDYGIDEKWLHQLHLDLYRQRRTLRAQVHTHRGRAFHSKTDDTFPAVNVAGFLSLVVPRFARPPVRRDGSGSPSSKLMAPGDVFL